MPFLKLILIIIFVSKVRGQKYGGLSEIEFTQGSGLISQRIVW